MTAGRSGLEYVAGVDEAGRGPLAGPVAAAAVILDERDLPAGLADSKMLSEAARERAFERSRARRSPSPSRSCRRRRSTG